jgi:hypothetical protein
VAPDVTRTSYAPPAPLEAGRTYFWQIVATDGIETTPGFIWSFTTAPANQAPNVPAKPSPPDGETDVPVDPVLTWLGGDPDDDPVFYTVYLGTRAPLPEVATGLTETSYAPRTLSAGETYYWAIVASDRISETQGPVWSFSTIPPNLPPYEPYAPDPAHRETDVPLDQVLTWRASDPERDRLTYDIYFGALNPPLLADRDLTSPSYDPGLLRADTTYYWSVTVSDGEHETVGPTWSFRTAPANIPPDEPYAPNPADREIGVPLDQALSWRCYDPDRDALTYDVYFGTTNPPLLVSRGLTSPVYYPRALSPGQSYYWAIKASDGIDETTGPTWRFQTADVTYVYLPLVMKP